MITLEQKTTRNGKTYWYTYPKRWRTQRGAENYRDNLLETHHYITGWNPEDFRITGNEERRTRHNGTGTIRVGDIFVASWGYNMSLNDFYEVTELSKTGKTCTIRPIKSRIVEGSSRYDIQGCCVLPVTEGNDRYCGQPITRKRISFHSGFTSINIDTCRTAFLMKEQDFENGYYENHND